MSAYFIEHLLNFDGALALSFVLAVVVDEGFDLLSLERRGALVHGFMFCGVTAVAHVLSELFWVLIVGQDALEHKFLNRACSTRKSVLAVDFGKDMLADVLRETQVAEGVLGLGVVVARLEAVVASVDADDWQHKQSEDREHEDKRLQHAEVGHHAEAQCQVWIFPFREWVCITAAQ